jgi:sortase A
MKSNVLRFAERLLLAAGLTLLVMVATALVDRSISSRRALVEFDRSQNAYTQDELQASTGARSDEGVDISLWSPKRVREYRESLLVKKDAPLGVLRLDRLHIRVPVFEGTDDLVLNRGVGWIAGTARPGEAGNSNVGIAGHRDGFFRGLKDVAIGDKIQLSTPGVVSLYAVDSTEIVIPERVEVLQRRGVPSLTLVTCYPFYFIGDAPQRFIVHATLQQQVGVRESLDRSSAM